MADWQDTTSSTYWDAATGTWNGTSWDENVALSEVKLTPTGWETGYAPTKMKITASAASLTVCYKTSSGAQYVFGYTPGDEINITQAGDIEFVQAVDDGDFQVTKLELYGDEITLLGGGGDEEEAVPYSGPYRMFTRNYSTSDVNYVYDWEYDHLESGYASGNDEVSMRCMRLFEMESCSGDTRVGMLLFTDTDTTGRQTWTVIDSTEYLFNKDMGITTDTINADGNVLFIFEKNPTDLSGGTDESDFPVYLRKYIEYAVLERAYAADTDGQIASLRDYWAMRKTIGLKAIKLFMGKRKADRNYRMTTKGVTGWRTRRAPRLPDSYPSVVR